MNFLKSVKTAVLDLLFPVLCVSCQKEGELFCVSCREKLMYFPPNCFVCRKLSPPKGRVTTGRTCLSCRKKSNVYAYFAPFSYDEEPIRELIHHLKYGRIRAVSNILAEFLEECMQRYGIFLPRNVLVMPIPLYKSRERTRGFNQARLIAEELARRLIKSRPDLNLGLACDILQKIKKTKPQTELSGKERRENVAGVFRVNPVRTGASRPVDGNAPSATSVSASDRSLRCSNGVNDTAFIKNKTVLLLDDVKTTGATLEEAARVLKEAGAKRVWAVTVAR